MLHYPSQEELKDMQAWPIDKCLAQEAIPAFASSMRNFDIIFFWTLQDKGMSYESAKFHAQRTGHIQHRTVQHCYKFKGGYECAECDKEYRNNTLWAALYRNRVLLDIPYFESHMANQKGPEFLNCILINR